MTYCVYLLEKNNHFTFYVENIVFWGQLTQQLKNIAIEHFWKTNQKLRGWISKCFWITKISYHNGKSINN